MNDSVYTRQQYWGNYEDKEAEVGDIMPLTVTPGDKPDKGSKTTIPKTGSAQPVNPRVNVEGLEAPARHIEKQAKHFALPSLQRYPLDSYAEVKTAASYFAEYRDVMAPVYRREYCVNLTKRAEALAIPVSAEIQKYASAAYASHAELEASLFSRWAVLQDEGHQALLNKLAHRQPAMEPEDFAVTLAEFDKLAEIDHLYDSAVVDPYYTTFGKEAADVDEDGSFVIGNDIVSHNQLKCFADCGGEGLEQRFGCDFLKEFRKDPVGIFKSLPVDQQKVVSRLANEPRIPR